MHVLKESLLSKTRRWGYLFVYPVNECDKFIINTHRLIPQVLDSAVKIGCLPQQSCHVFGGTFVKIRTRTRPGKFERIPCGLLLGRAHCNRPTVHVAVRQKEEKYNENFISFYSSCSLYLVLDIQIISFNFSCHFIGFIADYFEKNI
jgi:hypothetical protein